VKRVLSVVVGDMEHLALLRCLGGARNGETCILLRQLPLLTSGDCGRGVRNVPSVREDSVRRDSLVI